MSAHSGRIPDRLLSECIGYPERELIKKDAWRQLTQPTATLEERKQAALLIVCAWWHRNRSLCPDFDVYVRHLLAADRPYEHGGTLHEDRFGADVLSWLIESYGIADPCFIRPGFSDFQKRLKPRAGGHR